MGDTAQTTTTRMYASIRDQLASEITAGVYPAGALLPSIREIMERWEVSTTTAAKSSTSSRQPGTHARKARAATSRLAARNRGQRRPRANPRARRRHQPPSPAD